MCKNAAVAVGVLVFLAGYRMFGSGPFGGTSLGGTLVALLVGGMVAGIGWVIGVIVAAKGQELQAVLDACINTSPFLSDSEKATAMSL